MTKIAREQPSRSYPMRCWLTNLTPRNRHGKIWIASGDGRGETRGAPPKSRSADFAFGRSHRDACQETQGNKCHSPPDLLISLLGIAGIRKPSCLISNSPSPPSKHERLGPTI